MKNISEKGLCFILQLHQLFKFFFRLRFDLFDPVTDLLHQLVISTDLLRAELLLQLLQFLLQPVDFLFQCTDPVPPLGLPAALFPGPVYLCTPFLGFLCGTALSFRIRLQLRLLFPLPVNLQIAVKITGEQLRPVGGDL